MKAVASAVAAAASSLEEGSEAPIVICLFDGGGRTTKVEVEVKEISGDARTEAYSM